MRSRMPALTLMVMAGITGHAAPSAAIKAAAPVVRYDVQRDFSARLGELAAHFQPSGRKPKAEIEGEPGANLGNAAPAKAAPRLSLKPALVPPSGPNPFHVVKSFDGISTSDLLAAGLTVINFATDSSGAIGRNHYVQTFNFAFAIYDKNGTRRLGPLPTAVFWSGFNAPCGGDWSDVVVRLITRPTAGLSAGLRRTRARRITGISVWPSRKPRIPPAPITATPF